MVPMLLPITINILINHQNPMDVSLPAGRTGQVKSLWSKMPCLSSVVLIYLEILKRLACFFFPTSPDAYKCLFLGSI
ncbi:hypothetical protein ES332_A13G058800v1 [Gossypium tomentosum]|nr:hypothetical protein ES332_A13G058800v1 [Gossypium tomentosum]